MNRRVLLIANPAAAVGRVARRWQCLLNELEARTIIADHVITDGPGHDGKLDVNVIEDLGRLETVRWFPKVLTGDHTAHPKVRYFAVTSVTVECEPQMEIQMDGELYGHTPVTFQLRPGALRVIGGHGDATRLESRLQAVRTG